MTTSPRVLTVGTGAIGAIYSWRLSQSCEVTTVCRSNYQAVKEKGFEIESPVFGNGVFRPHHVARSVSDCITSKPFDYILVTLKVLPEIYDIADIISPAVTKNTVLVLIQNGLDIEKPIAERFPNNLIISSVAYISVSQKLPGKIFMQEPEALIISQYPKPDISNQTQVSLFSDLLNKGGVNVDIADNIESTRWQKLIWNASFSPVCTTTGMTTTEVLRNKHAISNVRSIMIEIMSIANAEGHDFDINTQVDLMIAATEVTKDYKPSMHLDKERGSPMEIEALLGAPLKRAKAKKLAVPYLEKIYTECYTINQQIIKSTPKL
ncbi:2-dehydropantoate 2-reductase [Sporodiniella umbellata]|nr:2-dehydropantoate 2-reductase [Sporodiniella umbellata]